jgi:ABC-type enterochelin transport system substrate-binding protein
LRLKIKKMKSILYASAFSFILLSLILTACGTSKSAASSASNTTSETVKTSSTTTAPQKAQVALDNNTRKIEAMPSKKVTAVKRIEQVQSK